tara:strand:- start:500 stop:1009 length:510 start_codon:yes stop_codon:yes gene_type:complete
MAKEEFPEIKKENQGKFTKWVEKNMGGMDTCKAASKIMRSRTKKYSPAVVKMANYANNFGCKTKKEDGASVPLKGKQKNLPEHLKKKILASDGASIKKPRGTKEEKKEVKDSKTRTKTINKLIKGYKKNKNKEVAGKITSAERKEKNNKAREKANAKLVSKQIRPLLGH